jgi:adenosylcobinamide amidohydrolase
MSALSAATKNIPSGHGVVSPVLGGRWLVVEWPEPQAMLSWAIVGGGHTRSRKVVWRQIAADELRPPVDASRFLRAELAVAGHRGAVGLLTSRRLDAAVDLECHAADLSVRCIATVGLGNALAIGDPPGASGRIGTINVVCHVSAPLSAEALVEALSMAAEARTAAVLGSGARSGISGAPATGTGTDCIVIAAPEGSRGLAYVGKHTVAGHLIGACVRETISRGAAVWLEEQGR